MQFTLKIELGNDAMRTNEDVAEALANVARVFDLTTPGDAPIFDRNGNTIGSWKVTSNTAERLEYLRGELRAERISYGELAELQSLAEHIDPSDVELLEAAGVPEHAETDG